ncbi:unnamed protein product [Chrysodeixis includens]|uniref:Uncharacterized protein n=1 Tax=Chrysodeixis includens TaxID=689277 RepID=A0A9N8L2U5_CHRIL|nr:unnamed protein product [Chrysodeixis includens]
MEVNGTEARAEEAAVALALSVAVTVISAIGLLLNAYILFIIVITKQRPTITSSVKILKACKRDAALWSVVRYLVSTPEKMKLLVHVVVGTELVQLFRSLIHCEYTENRFEKIFTVFPTCSFDGEGFMACLWATKCNFSIGIDPSPSPSS